MLFTRLHIQTGVVTMRSASAILLSVSALMMWGGCSKAPGGATTANDISMEDYTVGKVIDYSINKDRMTDEVSHMALVRSTNAIDLGAPYSGAQRATLIFDVPKPKDGGASSWTIMISIEQGQILCDASDDCTIDYRFEGVDSRHLQVSYPVDQSTNNVICADMITATLFKNAMLRSKTKKLIVQLPLYQNGSKILEFDLSEFDIKKFETGEGIPQA